MPRRTSPAPKHRAPRTPVLRRLAVALTVTGAAVTTMGATATGVLPLASESSASSGEALDLTAASVPALTAARSTALEERGEGQVSRSDRRTAADPRKAALLRNESRSGGQVTRTEEISGDPRTIARALLPRFGFGSDQFSCLDALWTKESGWNVHADNPTSSAYGIPQSLPGEKMASAGADWATNPATQITWGLGYIKARYGTPCGAWSHSQSYNWY